MNHIVLIGAGALGGRHLQSLTSLGESTQVTVVDPSQASLETAKLRVAEVTSDAKPSAQVEYVEHIEQVPTNVDLAIIATSSAPRLKVLKGLLSVASVQSIVFEKVLFQSLSDYEEALVLLDTNGVQAWVNCPRRMFEAYSTLKLHLDSSSPMTMCVTGGGWGLACNAIHFIDIFAFLTNSHVESIDTSNLESSIFPCKRDGYIEVFGTLNVQYSSGHKLELGCSHGNEGLEIKVADKHSAYEINEAAGSVYKNGTKCDFDMTVRYQSELSQAFATQILCHNTSQLPSFEESAVLHKKFISALLSFYNTHENNNVNHLPIT